MSHKKDVRLIWVNIIKPVFVNKWNFLVHESYYVCLCRFYRISSCSRKNADCLFSSTEPKAQGQLIVYQSGRRLSVCLSVWLCVNIFILKYLRNQWANRNEILSEPALGWGKGCIRFWARFDRNSGVHGNG